MRRNYSFFVNLKLDFYSFINKSVCHSPYILFIFTVLVELAQKKNVLFTLLSLVAQK